MSRATAPVTASPETPDADRVLVRGGTVLDRSGERRLDVRVADGRVVEVGAELEASADEVVLVAEGCLVTPGFVDLHTHLREPGMTEAETIESGSRAAALGGYTAVVAMPNTDPTQDCVEVVEYVRAQGVRAGLCDVHPSGSITVGRAGERLAPFAELAAVGVRIFTDDGNGVQDAGVMRRALEYAGELGLVLAQHCEVSTLTAGAVMHEGECCSHLGLPGWPALAEELMVHRDIELARLTGSRVHLLHLSTARSVDLVRAAKADGVPVTAEATPHHISLTDELLSGYSTLFKVNPPLRTMADVEAVRAGLVDGTIDAIATDHAPHPGHAKERPLDEAPPGMLGLETALGVTRAHLDVDWPRLIALLSWGPAEIAGVADRHGRPVAVGEPANLTVIDPTCEWQVDPAALASLSRNTPYGGVALRGRVRHTILHGRPVVVNGEARR
ncbi:MAG: dihydroorotase [Actinomycetota bacterium]